ncbi:hypothetical protein SCUP234_00814 [Seiridium cupressi]
MKATTTGVLAAVATLAAAAKSDRTFAVLRFDGDGFMTEGRVDPIVSPGVAASHLHGIMGGSAFGTTVEGDQLLSSTCTNAKIKNDRSNYWAPEVFFHDPNNGTFTKVPLFYMNVYYFFEPTDDEIQPFPVGLKMVSGDAMTRSPPAFGGGSNLDPGAGTIQPVQFTCPRSSYDPASYPAGSDGTTAGMQDPNNKGAGAGFPLYPCDGYASPLRADIHFPSCYNPDAGLDDYKTNMAWPTITNGKQNCPSGYTHVPHIFFELYWNTPLFDDLWTPDGKTQPFVLANGDVTGYSLHGDFISGWDQDTLKTIIDGCNAGDIGMDNCPDIPGGLNDDNDCKIASPIVEALALSDTLTALPGNNPLSGWSYGSSSGSGSSGSGSSSGAASYSTSAVKSSAAATSAGSSPTTSVAASSEPVSSETLATYVISSVSLGGKKGKATTITSATELPEATAASAASGDSTYPTAVAANVEQPSAGSDSLVSTVYDIVTATQTITVWAEETAPVKRHAHEHVGHLARHRRSNQIRH